MTASGFVDGVSMLTLPKNRRRESSAASSNLCVQFCEGTQY